MTIPKTIKKSQTLPEAKNTWNELVKDLPPETETTMHVFGGDILSIWDKLPDENVRIYRFLIDDGTQLIGRVVHNNKD